MAGPPAGAAHSLAGLIAMRLTMAAALAAGVVAIGWLTRELVPSRPAAALFAATSVSLVPPLTQHSGQVLTDSVLLAAVAALLAALVRILRRGSSRRLVALVAVLAAASGLARATGMVFAGLAVGAIAVAGWRHAGVATSRSRWRSAAAPAVTVDLVTTVGAGWFLCPQRRALRRRPWGRGADRVAQSHTAGAGLGVVGRPGHLGQLDRQPASGGCRRLAGDGAGADRSRRGSAPGPCGPVGGGSPRGRAPHGDGGGAR